MGRKRKGKTGMMRVRIKDIPLLKEMARRNNLTLPDYLSRIARNRRI